MEHDLDLLDVMHTLQAEGWQWDLFGLTPEGRWRGWWYKPGDGRFTRAGDPAPFNLALLKAWRLRAYFAGSEGGAG